MSNAVPMDGVATKTAGLTGDGKALLPVTIGGATLPPGSTPQQRFEAALKGNVQPSQLGIGHTDGTAMRLAQGDGQVAELLAVKAKAPPPSTTSMAPPDSKTLEASRRAELAAIVDKVSTLPRDAAGRFTAQPVEVDAAGIDALNKAFAKLSPAERQANRGQYEEELAEFYNGRRLGETRAAFLARRNGKPAEAPAPSPYTPEQWAEGHRSVTNEHGNIPLERINPDALSGYKLHALIPNQHYSVATFAALATARKAGFTQEQVDAYFREQMKADGWIK